MPFACHPAYARRAYRPVNGFAVLGDIIQSLGDEQQQQQQHVRRKCSPTTNPKSDVYETSEEYIVELELPGVSDKKSVSLEFSDNQTLKVDGFVRRSGSACDDIQSEKPVETKAVETEAVDGKSVDTEMTDGTLTHDTEKLPSYRATVEETADENDDNMSADFEVIHTPRTSTPAPEKEKEKQAEPSLFVHPSEPAAPSAEATEPAAKETTERKKKPERKYWVAERSYGKFSKAFTFATLVDQDSVRATLDNGVLRVSVPKRKPYIRHVNIE